MTSSAPRSTPGSFYAREPDAFDEHSRSVATRFAPYAAVAAANMYAYEDARDMAEHLERALDSRAVIDQAKGILMEWYKRPPPTRPSRPLPGCRCRPTPGSGTSRTTSYGPASSLCRRRVGLPVHACGPGARKS
jgi:hypothetical protein